MNKHLQSRTAPRRLALAVALCGALAGMAGLSGRSEAAGTAAQDLSRVGALLPLAQFGTADASPQAVAERAGLLASLLAGSEVALAAPDSVARLSTQAPLAFSVRTVNGAPALVRTTARQAATPADRSGTDAEVAARARAAAAGGDPAERIRILLDPAGHESLAVHGAVADDYSSLADVGAVQARTAFDAVVRRLQASRALSAVPLALDGVKSLRLMQAERPVDGPVTTRVKAYLFEVPVVLGAIPVFGAEAVVAVHRSGQLASIHLSGPTVVAAAGQAVRRAVSSEALAQRARAEHPGATVVPLGLRYPWQAAGGDARASRPHEAFQVVPQGQADGVTFNGRAHYVFYSVEAQRARPLVWPQPQPEATGDQR